MKKSLVALAALTTLAATTTSFAAEVSITGRLDSGYLSRTDATTTANSMDRGGFGVDKSEIYFTATENLGAGQTVKAQLGMGGLDRSMVQDPKTTVASNGVTGRDSFISYTNESFGRIEVGNATPENYFVGIANAGGHVDGFDGKLFEARTANDYISYALPIGPLTLVATHHESSKGLGIGQGDAYGANKMAQNNNTLTALYNQSGLMAAVTYRLYNFQNDGAANTYLGNRNDVWNVQASYDFGVATVGGGWQRARGATGVQVDDYLVGAKVPVGAVTFSAAYAGSKASDVPAGSAVGPWDLSKYEGTKNGYSLGAAYNFSKNTALIAKYTAWEYSGYALFQKDAMVGGGNGASGYSPGTAIERSVVLSHTF